MRKAATQAREEVAQEEAAMSAAQGSGLNTKDSNKGDKKHWTKKLRNLLTSCESMATKSQWN